MGPEHHQLLSLALGGHSLMFRHNVVTGRLQLVVSKVLLGLLQQPCLLWVLLLVVRTAVV